LKEDVEKVVPMIKENVEMKNPLRKDQSPLEVYSEQQEGRIETYRHLEMDLDNMESWVTHPLCCGNIIPFDQR
jgi:hypothetical protein